MIKRLICKIFGHKFERRVLGILNCTRCGLHINIWNGEKRYE